MRAILTYHSIDDSGSAISVDATAFRRHVAFLASGAVRVTDVAGVLSAGDTADAVALTFDDAFTSFAEIAWPLLRERGLPVTLFVVTGHAGGTNAWGGRDAPGIPTRPLLGWDALAHLAEQGVQLGAHSRAHPDLTQADDSRLVDEMEGSAADLAARTGTRPASFAYPYGACDERVVAAARPRFACACTTELRPLASADDAYRLPRLDAYYLRAPGRLEAWGRPALRSYLRLRQAGRAVRHALGMA